MNLKDDVRPITYLKNNTAELVRDVSQDGRTVLITQNGEAKVVVMDVDTYSRWRNALALMKMISQGEADVDAGRVLTQDEAFARAERTIERATADE
ncbi:MAG: type II toxin-antitoxin system Phd/YefM family antitoxin [Candidatus Alcyoniella australis]|nr:type II toxin-antitoxin system Phd/YefM family antitoxin [Candidatus Alcyoniella australis]